MAASLGTQRGALERQIHAAEAANKALEAQLVKQHAAIAEHLTILAGEVEAAKARYETSIRAAEELCSSLKGELGARFEATSLAIDDVEKGQEALRKKLGPIKNRFNKFFQALDLLLKQRSMGGERGRLNAAKALLR